MASRIDIKRGLSLPLEGPPTQVIEAATAARHVALVADDYIGMKPTMEVREGDRVKLGQLLFTDKKNAGVRYTSPGAGEIVSVNRGAKRKFQSVVVRLDGDEEEVFGFYPEANLTLLKRDEVRDLLVESGLWTALRTRPFSAVPPIDQVPEAIFVTAIDTNPLAADPAVVLANLEREFVAGLEALSVLADRPIFLCVAPDSNIPGADLGCVETVEFAGPHPAGLPGTHIHYLAPASLGHVSWHIGYQDVAAVGHLMRTGKVMTDRVVSVAGPVAVNPRLVRTRLGASLSELTEGEVKPGLPFPVRVVSGSVFAGRAAKAPCDFLGRYHTQVSLLLEGKQRDFIGWMGPGFKKFSVVPAFAANWIPGAKRFALTTSTEGSHRSIVPLGNHDKVMPLRIIPAALLKSLAVGDTDSAQSLGCLELDEEDLALCTFVCTSKNDYGPMLRESLTRIEHEG
ncbi:Na(+)-translocating NADH-quinone reductase subunit A [Pirellulimonas nuda]|uniref:Na(+)-translocating NADH-quinone reductase subunit A n=1 Tax=Pirellulimonas nuda TaxID=2528009 RepID=A0A518DEW8_9BACT|nr:Na(+)-translocating NADH-quinone reductase subunit A [Pirellulimonas nuda]QDU90019.1 Na(+)-translocating NADH-quinone reductase subunit A [Pirellulimonas nuda]